MQNRTGVEFIEYDCCVNSCICFGVSPNYEACSYCGKQRYHNGRPRSVFLYIPLIHRLRLQYANSTRAEVLSGYPASVLARERLSNTRNRNSSYSSANNKQTGSEGLCEDFWNGDLFKKLRQKGVFITGTDVAFLFSTDGVRLFKTRSNFQIYPLLLINLNLPPSESVKQNNLLLSGVVPGPKTPKDLDLFLWPLVWELKRLETGVEAWNAFTNQQLILRAYIPLIGADMVAWEKLMHVQGNKPLLLYIC